MNHKILKIDPYLKPYEGDFDLRMNNFIEKRSELCGEGGDLVSFANGYNYFGIHRTKTGWVYREWAPSAAGMFLTGDFCNWDTYAHPMTRLDNGVFEIQLKGKNALQVGQKIQAIVIHNGQDCAASPPMQPE